MPAMNFTQIEETLKKACELIAKFEGYKLTAYKCPAGVWTVGYGHTNGVKSGDVITSTQAQEFLQTDVKIFFDAVMREVSKICNQNQIIALTSFAFNLGVENLRKSTLLREVKRNPQNLITIKGEFLRWIYTNGKPLEGLKTRRNKEFQVYAALVQPISNPQS